MGEAPLPHVPLAAQSTTALCREIPKRAPAIEERFRVGHVPSPVDLWSLRG